MKEKIKCDICHHEFYINKNDTYIAILNERKGLFFETVKFDVIDCPECGCQKLLKRRLETEKKESNKE